MWWVQAETARERFLKRTMRWVLTRTLRHVVCLSCPGQAGHSHVRPGPCWNERLARPSAPPRFLCRTRVSHHSVSGCRWLQHRRVCPWPWSNPRWLTVFSDLITCSNSRMSSRTSIPGIRLSGFSRAVSIGLQHLISPYALQVLSASAQKPLSISNKPCVQSLSTAVTDKHALVPLRRVSAVANPTSVTVTWHS